MKTFIIKLCKSIINRLSDIKVNNNLVDGNFNKVPVNNIIIKKKTKIQKQCFYINVGDKPKYMDLSIQSFKNTNDTIKLDVLNFTYDEFFSHKYTWNILVKNNFQKIKMLSRDQMNVVIRDFAMTLIRDYGGIYLNNKTFVVRNLDYILENNNRFVYSSIFKNLKVYKNYNMFGCFKNCTDAWEENVIYPSMNYNLDFYETIKTSFLNGNLRNEMFNYNCLINQCPVYTFELNS